MRKITASILGNLIKSYYLYNADGKKIEIDLSTSLTYFSSFSVVQHPIWLESY